MTTAGQVASELRKLADALDKEPDASIVSPSIYFCCSYCGEASKPAFLAIAKLLPRPLNKKPRGDEYRLEYSTKNLSVQAYIERNQICTLIEPAKPAVYDCPSILSEAEEAALGQV